MLISGNKARKNPFFNMVQKNGKNSLKLVIKPKKILRENTRCARCL